MYNARRFKCDVAPYPTLLAICAHLESLHSHDAVAVVAKGLPGGFDASFTDFASLVC